MVKQRKKNRFIINKDQPYEYNIAIIILGELCNEGIINIFVMAEVLIKLMKLYNLPFIDICRRVFVKQKNKHEPRLVKKGVTIIFDLNVCDAINKNCLIFLKQK